MLLRTSDAWVLCNLPYSPEQNAPAYRSCIRAGQSLALTPCAKSNSTIQDFFDRERVRERIVQLRRDAPLHDFLKASAQTPHPRYFEAFSVHNFNHIDSLHTLSDKSGEHFLVRTPLFFEFVADIEEPLAAEIDSKPSDSTNMGVYSKFSALSIDRQLALLYQVNGSRRKRKGRTRTEEHQETLSRPNHNIQQSHRILTLACLVSMPHPRRSADLESRVLVLGTTVYPWEDHELYENLTKEAAVAKEG